NSTRSVWRSILFECLEQGCRLCCTGVSMPKDPETLFPLQVCEKGSFLSEQGECLPCNCKGNADSCEDITGVCINCRDHSTGDFCEMCEEGYTLSVSLNGRHHCQPCSCPLSSPSNNFAVRCEKGGVTLRCICQEGYAGHYCERCAPGYYGNPMVIGDSCKRCDCNGNSDPNLIFSECHNVTGHCQHCWGNTAGTNCERCAPGYYGDAIDSKNCRECDCTSGHCDMQTGECLTEVLVSGCDDCIWQLIGDLKLSNKTLDELKVTVLNISTGAAANDRLKYYNYTAHQLQVDLQNKSSREDLSMTAGHNVFRKRSIMFWNIFTCEKLKDSFCELSAGDDRVLLCVFSVLRRIHQLEKKLKVTGNRLAPVRELMSRFSARLTEAQDFLLRATSTLEESKDKNRANIDQLHRKKVLPPALPSHSKALPVEVIFVNLPCGVCVQNVTEYHAAIDGAGQRLVEKTERLMLVDRDLVQRADEHAQNMEQDANMLEEDLRESDANGFVQRAISAVNVYNNIVKYIEDANVTSRTTLNLAQRAEDVRSPTETLHIPFSVRQLQLSFICLSGHHRDKCAAGLPGDTKTLNRSAEVLQTVTPINDKVEEWDSNMKKNKYSVAAYEQAVVSAGKAVERLNELVPELLNRLKVVENKKPVNNVTTNIVRIRELIAQARSVAKKVQVSMKFDGQSSVEVHPHSNLDDLKTVTSISLFMRVDPDKDPIEDRFVLYLGDKNGSKDYMGLAIKSDNLVFVYKLGGEEVEISLTSKPVSQWPAVFNYIKVERLGRHGKLFLTIPSQNSRDEQKFIQKGEAPGKESLFDLDPKGTVFFVGRVPPDVTLPPLLSLAPFVGCIELASLNNDVISLYNFKKIYPTNNLLPPCPRYKLAFSQSRIASYLFDGTGYALINNIERKGKFGTVTRFDIAVRTVANSGIIFLMVNGDKFFLLEIKDGFLRLTYDFGFSSGPILLENNSPKFQINDARYHEMSVIYHQSKKVILLVDKSHVKTMENPKTTLPFSDIYIGGAPSSILKLSSNRPELSSVVGLKGCVKGFQFLKKDFNLLEEPGTIGISSGCPEESFMSRNAYFTGSGYLGSTAKISPFDNFEGGMNFRTLQPNGLLFYHNEESSEFSISVENGAVVLNCKGTKVKSHKKQYNDGRTHFLMASVNNFSLMVDDKDKRENKRPSSATKVPVDSPMKTFYFGGSPNSSFKNFSGCISHVYISRQDQDIEAEDFQKYTEKVQTSLQDCPVVSPPAAHLFRHRNGTFGTKQTQKVTRKLYLIGDQRRDEHEESEPNMEPCFLSNSPRGLQEAFHYGTTANSRQFNFSMSLKTQSSFGLIFYISDSHENNFIALFLSHGKIVYAFNVADQRVKISSKGRLDDGAWHHINLSRDGSLGHLTVDGLKNLEGRARRRNDPWQISRPLFIGGVFPGLALKNVPRNSALSFTGCLKDLKLNEMKLSTPAETFGVTPCFEGHSEPGTYFSEEGGYLILDKSHQLGLKFELVMELRPRVASAVLLHARSSEQFFTLYIHQGAVVVLIKDGPHEFFTKVSPRRGVCDGAWHRITVIRDVGILQLNVDSEISHVVGQVKTSSADSEQLVVIGGFPSENSFVGCMKNLSINNSPVSFSKAALVSGAVNVGTCPAA
uniref:Laminin, alpha 4 n=1 Tax=Oryzias melastigma TaxID=30732 RepID=A0A3B3BAH3_ORYME